MRTNPSRAASLFISATNRDVVFDTWSASATAASFADCSNSAYSSCRTVSRSPGRRPSSDTPMSWLPWSAASALTRTTVDGAVCDSVTSAVMIFVVLAMARRSSACRA